MRQIFDRAFINLCNVFLVFIAVPTCNPSIHFMYGIFCFRPPNINDKIFALIGELAGENREVKIADAIEKCTSKGYTPTQVDACIDEYESLNVWQINQTRTKITLI